MLIHVHSVFKTLFLFTALKQPGYYAMGNIKESCYKKLGKNGYSSLRAATTQLWGNCHIMYIIQTFSNVVLQYQWLF